MKQDAIGDLLNRVEQYAAEWRPIINQGAPTGFGPENVQEYNRQTCILAGDIVRMFCEEVNRRTNRVEAAYFAIADFSCELRRALDERANEKLP